MEPEVIYYSQEKKKPGITKLKLYVPPGREENDNERSRN